MPRPGSWRRGGRSPIRPGTTAFRRTSRRPRGRRLRVSSGWGARRRRGGRGPSGGGGGGAGAVRSRAPRCHGPVRGCAGRTGGAARRHRSHGTVACDDRAAFGRSGDLGDLRAPRGAHRALGRPSVPRPPALPPAPPVPPGGLTPRLTPARPTPAAPAARGGAGASSPTRQGPVPGRPAPWHRAPAGQPPVAAPVSGSRRMRGAVPGGGPLGGPPRQGPVPGRSVRRGRRSGADRTRAEPGGPFVTAAGTGPVARRRHCDRSRGTVTGDRSRGTVAGSRWSGSRGGLLRPGVRRPPRFGTGAGQVIRDGHA